MQRKLTGILAGAVFLIAIVSIQRHFRPALPQINPAIFATFGQVLADETVKAVAGHGRIVAVINAQQQLAGNPAHAELDHFQAALRKHNLISLLATEVLPVDADELVIGAGCSAAQLQAILTKYTAADAIVFLIGLPEWGTLQARGMIPQPGSTKIIVAVDGVVPTKTEYGGYFANGFLSVLIGMQPGSAGTVKPRTSQEWLDKHCQIYTAQNADTLPE